MCDQRYGTAANETLANTLGLQLWAFCPKIDIHMPSLDHRICGIGLDTAGDTWC